MTRIIVPPAAVRRQAKTPALVVAFRAVRIVQSKAAQIPGVLSQARDDIAAAWRESADALPNG